jgi:hypothetical protein
VVSGRGKQSALPIRRKSTCLRATSSGSAASTITDSRGDLGAAGHVWPVRSETCSPRQPGAMAAITNLNCATNAPIPPGALLSRSHPRPPARRLGAQPCRIQPSRGSVLGSGCRCWQSHHVPPGHSSWCCSRHDEQIMRPLCRGVPSCSDPGACERVAEAGQAAFARRIRRRRSAERSSSLSPPQVPYFSGRLTA